MAIVIQYRDGNVSASPALHRWLSQLSDNAQMAVAASPALHRWLSQLSDNAQMAVAASLALYRWLFQLVWLYTDGYLS